MSKRLDIIADYKNDKEVIFSLMASYCRQGMNGKTIKEILHDLSYDMGDYSFGLGDSNELREKIKRCIIFLNAEFQNVFDEKNNTQVSEGENKNFV